MQDNAATICVIGLGYVGLPLAIQFARCGAKIIGLDIDSAKVEQINAGKSYIKHIAPETIAEALHKNQLSASTDFARLRKWRRQSFVCRRSIRTVSRTFHSLSKPAE